MTGRVLDAEKPMPEDLRLGDMVHMKNASRHCWQLWKPRIRIFRVAKVQDPRRTSNENL